jgi:hypothetical protein
VGLPLQPPHEARSTESETNEASRRLSTSSVNRCTERIFSPLKTTLPFR